MERTITPTPQPTSARPGALDTTAPALALRLLTAELTIATPTCGIQPSRIRVWFITRISPVQPHRTPTARDMTCTDTALTLPELSGAMATFQRGALPA